MIGRKRDTWRKREREGEEKRCEGLGVYIKGRVKQTNYSNVKYKRSR